MLRHPAALVMNKVSPSSAELIPHSRSLALTSSRLMPHVLFTENVMTTRLERSCGMSSVKAQFVPNTVERETRI